MRQSVPGSRIDIAARADFHPRHYRDEGNSMFRILFVMFALVAAQVFSMSAASAQQSHDACVRDVTRFCRSHMNDDDQAVLACLQQHRARLSKACEKVLTDNGQ
jgi:hypothetical protein